MTAENTSVENVTHLAASSQDAQVIVDTAIASAEPHDLATHVIGAVVPAGAEFVVKDLEGYEDRPRRARGTATLSTVEAFIAYVERHHDAAATTVWVHPTSGEIVAVFNDLDSGEPPLGAWGDHRAVLTLLQTEEWKHWSARDGHLGGQVEFAEHIEDGLTEIVEPPAADLLELAQSFQAHTTASFKSANRLQDGTVGMEYVEDVEASAGDRGEISVPAEFSLLVAPFVGEDARPITARLRYRVRGGNLQIGYKLDRPDRVVRECLEEIAARIAGKFAATFLGTPRG